MSLIIQGPVPSIHRTCKLPQAEDGLFINHHRRSSPPSRVVLKLIDEKSLFTNDSVVDTLMSTLREVLEIVLEGSSSTECRAEITSFIHGDSRHIPLDPERE